ncbi:MAG: hypothetical protein IKD61_09165 [Oscillospiraceae bacterium]|nr:hypothetical protein [Oscillospiraceae bacterium]
MRVLRRGAEMNVRALAAAAALLLLAACGPRAEVRVIEVAEPEPAAVERSVSESDAEPDFILNPSLQRFHRPDCVWAERIDAERRIEYSGDRQTLIDVGYLPCHYCQP